MKFFRINVSGTKFFLSDKNILFDSPNIFTERFSEELNKDYDKKKRNGYIPHIQMRMAVDKSPDIFKHIHRYLQGYNLSYGHMSVTDRIHLLEDAKFYKLENLQHELERYLQTDQLRGDYRPLIDVEYPSEYPSSSEESDTSSIDSWGADPMDISDNSDSYIMLDKGRYGYFWNDVDGGKMKDVDHVKKNL